MNIMEKYLGISTIALSLLVGAPARADVIYLDGADESAGAVSGFAGQTREVGASGTYFGVIRLQLGERGDRGCFLRVDSAHVQDRSEDLLTRQLDLCGQRGPTDRSTKFVPLTSPEDTFIYGVGVCTSKTGNSERLKGVQAYRVKINADGTMEKLSQLSTLERPNCHADGGGRTGSWHTPALCDDGWIATQVVVNFKMDNGDEVFTGLNLSCQQVKVKSASG